MKPAIFLTALALALPVLAQTPAQELDVARGVIETALREHPKNAELHTLLGFVFRKMDRLDAAEESFKKAVEHNPRKTEAHYMLGMIHEKNGKLEEAKAAWKACLDAEEPWTRETARRHLAMLEKRTR